MRFVLIVLFFFETTKPTWGQNVNVRYNAGNEAILLLNAISNDERFNSNFLKEHEELKRNFLKAEMNIYFNEWQGKAISTMYLLSALKYDTLSELISHFEDPKKMLVTIKAKFAEPGYQNALKHFEKNIDSLHRWLIHLKNGSFENYYQKNILHSLIKKEQEIYSITKTWDHQELRAIFRKLLNISETPTITLSYFSGDYAYSLIGANLGISISQVSSLDYLYVHEMVHALNPNSTILDLQKKITLKDLFYNAAFQRIYEEFREGKEEEIIYAIGLYVSYKTKIISYKKALRLIRVAYASPKNLSNRGVPFAGVLFEYFVKNNWNWDSYESIVLKLVSQYIENPQKLELDYNKLLQPISGLVGLQLNIKGDFPIVEKAIANMAGEKAGIKAQDVIVSIDRSSTKLNTLDQVLEKLSGPKGIKKVLVILRDTKEFEYTIELT